MPQENRSTYIIGLALVLSATVCGLFYYYAQQASDRNMLSVTGSAKTHVTSDQAKLVVGLSRMVSIGDLSTGYATIARDLALTHAQL